MDQKLILACCLALALSGCASAGAKRAPSVSALPRIVPYTAQEKAAINAERPKVKACCPNTDKAMVHYGKLRDKVYAAEQIQRRANQPKKGLFGGLFGGALK